MWRSRRAMHIFQRVHFNGPRNHEDPAKFQFYSRSMRHPNRFAPLAWQT